MDAGHVDTYCPACNRGDHAHCDPLRLDAPGALCECWACLPNDREEPPP